MGKNDPFLNTTMGDYHLKELLAVGGMSRVYLGIDQKLERKAAVKVLELTQDWVDETIIQRFEREAKAVGKLEHSNIITIYQYGQHENSAYYLAMQFIDGKDLREVLRDYRKSGRQMPLDRAMKIMTQVADALDFAHKNGIIHRDIKPSNILLTENDDRAVLTDFGLVLTNNDHTMGTAFGTPRYIAPEQAVASQQAVAQSDIYSFAVIMYEILTGTTPFDGETPMEIALAHVSEQPEAPSKREASIPTEVDDVLLKALSKEPNDRYETAKAFVQAVENGYKHDNKTNAININMTLPEAPTADSRTDYSQAKKEKNNSGLIGVIIALLLVVGGGVAGWQMGLFGGLGSNNAEVVLYYNDMTMVIHNGGDYDITETGKLDFVRGTANEDADDFSGDRIPQDAVPAGECYRVALQGRDHLDPPQCSDYMGFEGLLDQERFFWRTEPVDLASFEVRWEGRVIQRCDTVRRGETGECRFTYPLAPPEEE